MLSSLWHGVMTQGTGTWHSLWRLDEDGTKRSQHVIHHYWTWRKLQCKQSSRHVSPFSVKVLLHLVLVGGGSLITAILNSRPFRKLYWKRLQTAPQRLKDG